MRLKGKIKMFTAVSMGAVGGYLMDEGFYIMNRLYAIDFNTMVGDLVVGAVGIAFFVGGVVLALKGKV